MFGGLCGAAAHHHRSLMHLIRRSCCLTLQLHRNNHQIRINQKRRFSSLHDDLKAVTTTSIKNISTPKDEIIQISRTTTTSVNAIINSTATTSSTTSLEKEEVTLLVDDLLRRTRSLMDNNNNDDDNDGGNNPEINFSNGPDDGRKKNAHHVIAFSGGIDSSVTTALIQRIVSSSSSSSSSSLQLPSNFYDTENVTAVLGLSPAVPVDQRQLAERVAEQIGVRFEQLETTEGDDEVYVANDGRACFACKTHLYTCLKSISDRYSYSSNNNNNNNNINDVILYNGTNADDLMDPTRLGLIAADEFHVRSPLRYLTKNEVRLVGRHLGLINWDYAASPCLRSRLAVGVTATSDRLQNVEFAERFVRKSLPQLKDDPTRNLRVRILSGNRAMIEVDNDDILNEIQNHIIPFPLKDSEPSSSSSSSSLSSWRQYFERDLGFSSVDVRLFKTGSVATMPTTIRQHPNTKIKNLL
jgi:uncharacterized protein